MDQPDDLTVASDDAVLEMYYERIVSLGQSESIAELGNKNEGSEDYNRLNVSERGFGDRSVRCRIERVQYGNWNGSSACLLGLRFEMQDGNSRRLRFDSARIEVKFSSLPPGPPNMDPVIQNYGPKRLLSCPTNASHKEHWKIDLSPKVAVEPTGADPIIQEQSYTKDYSAVLESALRCSSKHRLHDKVLWWVRENPKQETGVLPEIRVAMIVEMSKPAAVAVSIGAGAFFDCFAWPWTKDDPILLKPGVEFGPRIGDQGDINFAQLTDVQWKELVTFDTELQPKIHGLAT